MNDFGSSYPNLPDKMVEIACPYCEKKIELDVPSTVMFVPNLVPEICKNCEKCFLVTYECDVTVKVQIVKDRL